MRIYIHYTMKAFWLDCAEENKKKRCLRVRRFRICSVRCVYNCSNFAFFSDSLECSRCCRLKRIFAFVFKLAVSQVNGWNTILCKIHISADKNTHAYNQCEYVKKKIYDQITITHWIFRFDFTCRTEWKWTFLLRNERRNGEKKPSLKINESMKQTNERKKNTHAHLQFINIFCLWFSFSQHFE